MFFSLALTTWCFLLYDITVYFTEFKFVWIVLDALKQLKDMRDQLEALFEKEKQLTADLNVFKLALSPNDELRRLEEVTLYIFTLSLWVLRCFEIKKQNCESIWGGIIFVEPKVNHTCVGADRRVGFGLARVQDRCILGHQGGRHGNHCSDTVQEVHHPH